MQPKEPPQNTLPADTRPRDRVLKAITTPLGFFSLVILVCETVLGVLAAVVDKSNQRLALVILFSFLVLMVALVAAMAIWRPESLSAARYTMPAIEATTRCVVLANRNELYGKAVTLLSSAKSILDTTWGPDPPKAGAAHQRTQKKYREAQEQAIRRGAEYKELLSRTPARTNLIETLAAQALQRNNYDIRIVPAIEGLPSLIDFLVIDNQHILLSHMDSDDPNAHHRYLYVNSPEMAELFSGLFARYWNSSQAPTLSASGRAPNPADRADV